MSDGTLTTRMVQHPKLTGALLTALVVLSQVGIVAAGNGYNIQGP